MNFENLNLVELNAQEVQEVEGGWWNWFSNCFGPSWDFDYSGGSQFSQMA